MNPSMTNEQNAPPPDADWPRVNDLVHEYVEDYEFIGEDENGREGGYTPKDGERLLIEDAIHGLLSDEDFRAAYLAAAPKPAAPPSVTDADWEEGVRAATPEESAEIDRAAGLYKMTVRIPIAMADRLRDEALAADLVLPAYVRLLLAAAPKPAAPPSVTDAVLRKVIHWAESRCPCHEETPDPCTLCGATVAEGRCKAVEEIFPRALLKELRAALTHPGHKHAQEDNSDAPWIAMHESVAHGYAQEDAAQAAPREPVLWINREDLRTMRTGLADGGALVTVSPENPDDVPLYIDSEAK